MTGTCPHCGRVRMPLRADGTMRSHAIKRRGIYGTTDRQFLTTCPGTGRKPLTTWGGEAHLTTAQPTR